MQLRASPSQIMAKIAKPKKREASVHSRAYRRNATPPTEVAKAEKSATTENEHWLYNAQNAGVHKKSKTKKSATRQQHTRHLKALEKADRNSAVFENKVAKSKLRGKKIVARAKDWDELNEELTPKSNGTDAATRPVRETHVEMDGIEEQPTVETTPVDDAALAVEHKHDIELAGEPAARAQLDGPAEGELDIIT